ncbi:Fc.00g029400.m01.CDS01 [Cosmosporella sp. VM-42]
MAASMRIALRGSSPAVASVCRLSSFSPAKAQVQPVTQPAADHVPPLGPTPDAMLNDATARKRRALSKTYFDATGVLWVGAGGDKPPDPNKTKLGRTLRVLQERLPTLLQYPLPHDLLAPNITLHLFPSTHPHLPVVSGRVAYNAALWTSPIAWNRVPIIGNVKIEILAERMTSEPITFLPRRPGAMPEQLVVRWCEKCKKPNGIAKSLSFARGDEAKKAFTGLFIFDFDKEGRILSHTIEQAQAGGDWEGGVGAKFVGLTDWLLGGMKGTDSPIPSCERLRKRCHD